MPDMKYRFLGPTGLKVSVLSYGAWVTFGHQSQVDTSGAKPLLKAAYEAGINFFDNAEVYESGQAEEVMGAAIKELGIRRSDLVLSTKVFWGKAGPGGSGVNDKGLSRKHVIEGVKASLKRMQIDYADIVFAHRPDVDTPMEEIVRAFNWLIDQGLTFYWGTSEWSAQQIQEAIGIADKLLMCRPVAEQNQYNLFERKKQEGEYLPLFEHYGLGTTIWSPLASGLLTGKYSKDHIPEGSRLAIEKYKGIKESALVDDKLDKIDALKPVAEKLGCSLAQLAIAFTAANPHTSTVILGATSLKQLEDNIGALDVIDKLTPDVMEEIDSIFKNKPDPPRKYR